MALNCSPEFKGVVVQIVCAVEIPFGPAWALTNITSGTLAMPNGPKFHASEPSGSEEDFSIFSYLFLWFKPRTLGHYLNELGLGPEATYLILSN